MQASQNDFLSTAFDNRLSVTILRLPDGLDYSKVTEIEGGSPNGDTMSITPSRPFMHTSDSNHMLHADSNLNISSLGVPDSIASSVYLPISKHDAGRSGYLKISRSRFRQPKPDQKGGSEASEGEKEGGGRENPERVCEQSAAAEDYHRWNVGFQEETEQGHDRRLVVVR